MTAFAVGDAIRISREEYTEAVDESNGKDILMNAAVFRNIGRATDVQEYTREEAMRLAVETGHYGPW